MESAQRENRWLPLWAAGSSVLIAFLLQFWRPCFFLTDDSFGLAFPVLVESGHALKNGLDPAVSEFIFGGGYPLKVDPMFTPNRHPLSMLVSLLAGTGLENAMVDLLCLFNLCLASAGMAVLLNLARRQRLCGTGNGTILFLALSYTWSGFSLLLGSSGFWYLFDVAALPWLFAGLLLPSMSGGILLMTAAVFHALVGGYPSCSFFSFVLAGSGAAALCGVQRRWQPLVRMAAASLLGLLFSLPWLFPALAALSESTRAGAIDPAVASEKSMPVAVLVGSFFLSSISMIFGSFELFGIKAHAYALASCAGSWLVLAAIVPRRSNRIWDIYLGVAAVSLAVLIGRPGWLAELFFHLPLVSSMRWPYKEVFLFLFVLHLWAARGSLLDPKWTHMLAMVGMIFFLAPFMTFGAPSLSAPSESRALVLSGRAADFWEEVQPMLDPGTKIVPVMADGLLYDIPVYLKTPGPLLGSHNFPALFRIPSWSGYSATMPRRIFARKPGAANVFGVYSLSDKPRLMALSGLTLIEMRSLNPLVIVAVDTTTGKEIKLPAEKYFQAP